MLRTAMQSLVLMLIVTQWGLSQEITEEVRQAAAEAAAVPASTVVGQLPEAAPSPSVDLDVLIGCVVFDGRGELRVDQENGEPEVNRAGTIGSNLAAKLNEERSNLPAGVSPGTMGANLLLQRLADKDQLQSLDQFRLKMSADGVEAHLQNGSRIPRITGSASRGGNLTTSVVMENMGILISGSARISRLGEIVLTLQIERSAFGPEAEGVPVSILEGDTTRAPRIDTLTIKTEISTADGESNLLSSFVRSWGEKVTETFVVVTPTIGKP